uniref:Uncharacterized protein n=2 Tax=Biomphalaria glabrata TaxID=6526 RepID=A0A2C9M9M7_BIOGL
MICKGSSLINRMETFDNSSSVNINSSTDTSRLIKELEELAVKEESGELSVKNSYKFDGNKMSLSEGIGDSETLSQALKTVVGGNRLPQIINLADNDDKTSVSVYNPEVEVYVAPSFVEKSSGSNKVKITPVVNHVWEMRYYHGNLVAVHRDSIFVAYVLKGKPPNIGNVRVISRKTAHRVLLKDFQGCVMDIAFALSDDVILAAADEEGNLFVYSIIMNGDSILSNLILHINGHESSYRSLIRVIWCPYMPEDDAEHESLDPAKMLVYLHGTQAEVWNVDLVSKGQGCGPHSYKDVLSGVMCVDPYEPMMSVVNAAFAPDGSAIAVAYESGIVKFFLVELEGDCPEAECMYDWNPHDGAPLTSLFFLDDHKHPVSDLQLWKFALTGAKQNTEIKLWSCETWACVQTLKFNAPLSQPNVLLQMKSEIDLTSKYLALSDIHSRVLYILQIHQDYRSSTAHVSSLSQFTLTQPCLSFAIFEAGLKKFKHAENDSHLDEITTGELGEIHEETDAHNGRENAIIDGELSSGVQLKMFGVHTKALQELLIRYRPESSAPVAHSASVGSISLDELGLRDRLSDVSIDQSEHIQNFTPISHPPALMTPQAFSSSRGNSLVEGSSQLSLSSTSSFTNVTAMNEEIEAHSNHGSLDQSLMLVSSTTQSPQNRPTPKGNLEAPILPSSSVEGTELNSPINSRIKSSQPLNTSRSNEDILEDLFSSTQSLNKSLDKASSTGSFPVGRLMEETQQEEGYDEDDKEVATALGLKEVEKDGLTERPSDEYEDKNEVIWPDPPDVSKETKLLVNQHSICEDFKEPEFSDENEEAEVEEIIQSHVEDNETRSVDNDFSSRTKRLDSGQTRVLTSIDASIANLASQLHQQQKLMQEMQAELNHQREIQLQLHRHQMEHQQLQQITVQQPSLEKDINKLEDILISRMEHSLAQHMQKETQRLQESLKKSDSIRKQRDESLQTSVVTEVSKTVKDTVTNTLRTEIKQTVTPALHRFIEPMKDKIHQEVAHRLTACDTLLKENISKAVKSRSTMDVLAHAVGDVVYQQMQQAYTETFKIVMLPAFKSTMEKTVSDVHGVFQQGTKEYQLYIRQNLDQMLRDRVAAQEIVSRMEAVEQQFIHSVGQMKNVLVNSIRDDLAGQVAQAFNSLKDELLKDITKIVKEELGQSITEHGSHISNQLTTLLRSGAATPVPLSLDEDNSKDRIMRELRNGRINEAFQCALSASNLDLVVYTCEAAKHLEIFANKYCPLTQPVLLSLISQLSAHLEKNFELKLKYLEDAVINLDPEQPMTAEHIPNVLGALVQRLQVTDAHGGDAKKIRAIRMIVMAAKSLLS